MLSAVICDDETAVSKLIRYFITENQIPVEIVGEAADGVSALELITDLKPSIAFMDVQMPGLTGLQVIERAKAQHISTKFIVITAYSVFEYAQTALRLGADDMLLKPIRGEQLIESINRAVGMRFTSNRQVNNILLYIQDHLSENLQLSEIAEHFSISSYHLSHLFKKHMGTTCIDCIHRLRIDRAKDLFLNTSFSIKEVAEMTGYSNLNNFYMHFKKETGMTPKAFLSGSGSLTDQAEE